MQNLPSALEARLQIDVVYTDMSRGFDTVMDSLLNNLGGNDLCDGLVKNSFIQCCMVEDNLLSIETQLM